MPKNVSFFDPQTEAEVKRKRSLAQQLYKQGEQTPSETVSGIVVEKSPLEGLARALTQGAASYTEREANRAQTEDTQKKQQRLSEALKVYGTDPQAAGEMLMSSPATSDLGMQMQMRQLERQRELEDFDRSEVGKDKRAYIAAQYDSEKWNRNAAFQREMLETKLTAKEGVSRDPETGQIVTTPIAKPLPVGALKIQQDAIDAFTTAKNTQDLSTSLIEQIDSGELDLGLLDNAAYNTQNALGVSTDKSVAFGNMRTSLEKLRNDTLRLNKGVQTEGDAQRAMNEVVNSITDPELFKVNMQKLNAVNARAAEIQKNNVNTLRSNYGADPYDFEKIGGFNAYGTTETPEEGEGVSVPNAVDSKRQRLEELRAKKAGANG